VSALAVQSPELPSYLSQGPEVRAYFSALKARPAVMRVRKLDKHFGTTTALSNVSFDVHAGEFVSVIGPSGCGKSTLIRTLAGLATPSSGEVLLDGAAVTGPGPERGMVFQGYTLFPWLTVRQNVMFGPRMRGEPEAKAAADADAWLEVVGLTRVRDQYPETLSGGMKQRVAIARALANEPRVLLMDEPFGALDAQTRAGLQQHLLRVWEAKQLTVLFITHDLDEAIFLADRIIVLAAHPGRVAEIIEVPLERPRVRAQLLRPEFLAVKQRLEALIYGQAIPEE
jgi:NitT/TauT family transport system ATP-binding protein